MFKLQDRHYIFQITAATARHDSKLSGKTVAAFKTIPTNKVGEVWEELRKGKLHLSLRHPL